MYTASSLGERTGKNQAHARTREARGASEIDHFRVPLSLSFEASLVAKFLSW